MKLMTVWRKILSHCQLVLHGSHMDWSDGESGPPRREAGG
jgi:hypothetical protein